MYNNITGFRRNNMLMGIIADRPPLQRKNILQERIGADRRRQFLLVMAHSTGLPGPYIFWPGSPDPSVIEIADSPVQTIILEPIGIFPAEIIIRLPGNAQLLVAGHEPDYMMLHPNR